MIFKINLQEPRDNIFDQGWQFANDVYTKSDLQINLQTKTIDIDRWHLPLYKNGYCLSTFPFEGFALIPYDHDMHSNYLPNEHIELQEGSITVDEYCEQVITTVKQNLIKGPYVLADSKGVDCTMIRAIMDYYNIKYSTFNYNLRETDADDFYQHLQSLHWGFNQTPYFGKSTQLVTGMYGDEYMLRNPKYVQWHLNQCDLDAEYNKQPNCYMYKFYQHGYQAKIKKQRTNPQYLQVILNDYQLWSHNLVEVSNPIKDRQILLKGLQLDQDTIIKQVTDAWLSKKIIKLCNPKLLSELDSYKNQSDAVFLSDL